MMFPPPVMTTEFLDAIVQFFWNGPKELMSTRVYYYWHRKFQPIEDEL